MPKLNLLLLALISITLTACMHTADDPKTVADTYWQHLQTGNMVEAEKLVSTNSHQAFSEHATRMKDVTQLQNEDAKTIVSTTITTVNPKTNFSHTQTFNTVLVLQQGQWKIDASQTQMPATLSEQEEEIRQLADDLSESMQENIESVDKAMNQGMNMLNEALQEGSKEMGDSLLHMMNELNSSMQESIDKMKKRREQQMQEQQQEQENPQQAPQPDSRKGEGMI